MKARVDQGIVELVQQLLDENEQPVVIFRNGDHLTVATIDGVNDDDLDIVIENADELN